MLSGSEVTKVLDTVSSSDHVPAPHQVRQALQAKYGATAMHGIRAVDTRQRLAILLSFKLATRRRRFQARIPPRAEAPRPETAARYDATSMEGTGYRLLTKSRLRAMNAMN